jgi:hypothetical protein
MKPPERYKSADELSVDEMLRVVQAARRGSPEPKFERDDYRAYKANALRAAGLTDEADASDPGAAPDLENMEDHLRAIQRR